MQVENYQHYTFEARPYTETATVEEIKAIKDRVYLYDKQIIFFKELPVQSDFSVNIAFDQITELAQPLDQCGLIIDLSAAKRPNARVRRTINQRFKKICDHVDHVAYCT